MPRGLRERIIEEFDKAGVKYKIEDKRTEGRKLNISFKGELRGSQIPAVETMLENDTGILLLRHLERPWYAATFYAIYMRFSLDKYGGKRFS